MQSSTRRCYNFSCDNFFKDVVDKCFILLKRTQSDTALGYKNKIEKVDANCYLRGII